MTSLVDNPLTDIIVLSQFDMDQAPPCEHSQHGELHNDDPAAYVIRSTCRGCPDAMTLLICNPCYTDGMDAYLECEVCGYVGESLFMWRVIQVL